MTNRIFAQIKKNLIYNKKNYFKIKNNIFL